MANRAAADCVPLTILRALLLPLKSGANGINLVEAQHVFLVEPLIETAVEAQAIGRVHRMSQLKPTTVLVEEAVRGCHGPRLEGSHLVRYIPRWRHSGGPQAATPRVSAEKVGMSCLHHTQPFWLRYDCVSP